MTGPTHFYTAEALGLTPAELADPAFDEPADVDVEAHLHWLATGEGEPFPPSLDRLAILPAFDDPSTPDPLADLVAEVQR